jgi:o-succinylbenzoate---CoA ligase
MPAPETRRLVALALPPGDAFVAALESAWERGDAVLPIDPAAPRAVTDKLIAAMRVDEPIDPDVALVIATSGSTGEPKGAQLTHAALAASARATHARIGLEPGDHWLSCLPWQHIGGLQVLLRARLFGIPLTIQPRFDIDQVAAADATLTSLVPTQLIRLLDAKVDLRKFRAILLGGAAAPPALLERAAAAGAPIVTTYGMSETAGGCVYDGRPLDTVQVRAARDGRLQIAGSTLMSGYRGRPDLTAEALVDGWLVTSDLGFVSTDGTVHVMGRADDVVITGGENIVASQVAAVIAGHPAVADVAVTGFADPEWGQRIVAVIVPRHPGAVPKLATLREWCGARMPAAGLPRGLVVVPEIPKLGSGKPDRLAINRLATAERSGRYGV